MDCKVSSTSEADIGTPVPQTKIPCFFLELPGAAFGRGGRLAYRCLLDQSGNIVVDRQTTCVSKSRGGYCDSVLSGPVNRRNPERQN